MQMQMELELPDMPRRVEAATKPQVASRSEIGYAQAMLSQWWLLDEGETTPELQWPRSIAVYDQMRRTDAQVTSLLEAVTLPIRRTPWRIDPAGARATVVKFVATDMGLPIVGKGPGKAPARTKGKFSWPDHLRLALLELVFGHMFFEQVYSVNDAGTEAHLKKLAPRMPSTIDQIKVAADGGLEWIKQRWTTDITAPQVIPVDRLVAYVRNREGGNWLGQSILRPAYKNWLLKDRLLRVQAQTIERNGMGIPLYKAQEDASAADIAAGKTMATLWRAGEAAGSAVPFGADLVLRGVEGTLPDADPAIRYHDEQIARAALAHFLNLGTQTGSWALGSTFADFFVYSLQTLAQQIADVTNQHVIEDLVDLNFGEGEAAPRLVFDEIGSQQAATAQALKTLVDAGVIHPDQVLEETSRQQYGLPPADPATATPPPGQAPPTVPTDPMPMGAESVAAARRPARRPPVHAKYNPGEMRDPGGEGGGRWIKNPATAVSAFTDGLGLDDRIELDPGDLVGSSSSVGDETDDADLNWVVVFSKEYGPEARIGVTPKEQSNGWAGNPETDSVAIFDAESISKLRTKLAAHVAESNKAARAADKAWRAGSPPTDPKLLGTEAVAIGEAIGAADFADLAWDIYLTDDDPTSWQLNVKTSPDSEGINLGPKGAKDLLANLDTIEGELRGPGPTEEVTAAAGIDTHPGGEELKHYWVYGEGAAKWATWTELYDHLKSGKGLTDEQAKRIAASWFHLRYGYWPGDRRNDHGVHARHRFDPAEPRESHSGKWSKTGGAAGALADEAKNATKSANPARHVATVHGPFTMTTEPGHVHTAWPATTGEPFTMDLTAREANILCNAIDRAGAAVDAYLEGGAGTEKAVGRKRVKVGSLDVVVSGIARPDAGNGTARFESVQGWSLELPLDEAELIQSALSDGASEAEAGEERGRDVRAQLGKTPTS